MGHNGGSPLTSANLKGRSCTESRPPPYKRKSGHCGVSTLESYCHMSRLLFRLVFLTRGIRDKHDLTCDYVLYRFPRCLCSSGWVGGHSFPSSRVLLATASGTERSLPPLPPRLLTD